jgi:UDP-N-acetylmuramyl pentapeptide synthase
MYSFEAGLNALRVAEASRRIVIMGDVLDTGLTVRPRFRDLGRRAAEAADMVIFIGVYSAIGAKAAFEAGMKEDAALAFATLPEAAAFLSSEMRAGDLVLLQGWVERHIERVILSQMGAISCWIDRCRKWSRCERCPELGLVPTQPLVALEQSAPPPAVHPHG